jgi:hypothetical protein
MEKTSFFKNLARLYTSFVLVASFNFFGCKSSQLNSPQQNQSIDSLHFSSFEVDLHHIIVTIHHDRYDSKDTVYLTDDSLFDVYGFAPSKRTMDKMGTITQSYDTSTSDCKGTYTTGHYTSQLKSAIIAIDTVSRSLSSFTFHYYSSSSYDGCACRSCGSGSTHSDFFIRVRTVPIIYSANQDIVAKISSADLLLQVDSLSKRVGSDNSEGAGGHSSYDEALIQGVNPPASDSYIIIKLNH